MSALDAVLDRTVTKINTVDPSVLRGAAALLSGLLAAVTVGSVYIVGGTIAVVIVGWVTAWVLLHGLVISMLGVVPRGGGPL